jgi:hypothetical protein
MATDVWDVQLAKNICREFISDKDLEAKLTYDDNKNKVLRITLKGLDKPWLFSIVGTGCIKADEKLISEGLINLHLEPEEAKKLAKSYVQELDELLYPLQMSSEARFQHDRAAKHDNLIVIFDNFIVILRNFVFKVNQATKI